MITPFKVYKYQKNIDAYIVGFSAFKTGLVPSTFVQDVRIPIVQATNKTRTEVINIAWAKVINAYNAWARMK